MSDAESVGSGEDDLIAAARTGSQDAMIELYHRHRGLVIGYVLRMTGDRDLADEVFASTFAAFFAGLPRYRSRGHLAAYLLRIARGRLADEARVRSRLGRRLPDWGTRGALEAEPIDFTLDPSEAAATSELAGRAVLASRSSPNCSARSSYCESMRGWTTPPSPRSSAPARPPCGAGCDMRSRRCGSRWTRYESDKSLHDNGPRPIRILADFFAARLGGETVLPMAIIMGLERPSWMTACRSMCCSI